MPRQAPTGQTSYWVPIVLVFVVIVGGAVYLCYPPTPPAESGPEPPLPPEVEKLMTEADTVHGKKDWCAAEQKWKAALKALDSAKGSTAQGRRRLEAERNHQVAQELCRILSSGVNGLQPPPPPEPPTPITPEELLKYYPKGRTIHSVAWTTLKGRGVNRNWGLRGEAHFLHIYQVVSEVAVKENDGRKLECLLHLRDVSQTLAVSREEIELHLPDQPLLRVIWKNLEEQGLQQIPGYKAIKTIGQILDTSDPNGKRLLSTVVPYLSKAGIGPESSAGIEWMAQVEKLSGLKVRLTYVNGVGVTRIEVEDGPAGKKFDRDALIRLARSSSLLLDYYLFPGANKKVGETWQVRAEDLGSVLPLLQEGTVSGLLTLERKQDRAGDAILSARAGDLTVTRSSEQADEKLRMVLQDGTITYSPKDLLARHAELRFQLRSELLSRDHLLFQLEQSRDITFNVLYDAERINVAGNGER